MSPERRFAWWWLGGLTLLALGLMLALTPWGTIVQDPAGLVHRAFGAKLVARGNTFAADIRPARAFPVDPASGEGFNNTGEALVLSPALFKKYYAAAEFVSDHAVLTTDGLRFAPHPAVTFADRQKLYEHLRRALAGNPSVRVLVDRRQRDRRKAKETVQTERRASDRRRRQRVDEQLRTFGWALVLQDLARGDHQRPTR